MTILVCGDAMIDRYLWGDVHRISPEAPVPVARIERIEERPGGAANVAANVEALGEKCLRLFSEGPKPIEKIRVIGRNQQMMRIDFDPPQLPVRMDNFLGLLPECSTVVLSDYGKGALNNIHALISLAKSHHHNKFVLVDPKGSDCEQYAGADLIKPNLNEMKELVGGWKTEAQLTAKAHKLRKKLSLFGILLTRASEGMTLYAGMGEYSIKSEAKEVYDVTGAGDTAIAAFAVAYERRCSWEDCMKYANKAAGIVVGRFGTAVAAKEEVFGNQRSEDVAQPAK